MSETYETEEKNQITVIEVLLIAVGALVAIPVLPFNVLYTYLMLKTSRKENLVMYPCIAIIALMCTKIGLFFEETAKIAVMLVKGIFNHTFAITAYRTYSLTSWVILTAVSFAVASYAVKRIRYNLKLEAVGIQTLSRQY